MSGHSKWSTIKHQKAIEDKKRSSVFTKIAKKIHIAVKKGGSDDINTNPYLRACVEEARSVNMPMANIKRAIDKASGSGGEIVSNEIIYEAYGPGGVGILITSVTDNRNRTGGEVKNVLDKHDAKLGAPGSVSYMKQLSQLPKVIVPESELVKIGLLIEALEDLDDVIDVWTSLN